MRGSFVVHAPWVRAEARRKAKWWWLGFRLAVITFLVSIFLRLGVWDGSGAMAIVLILILVVSVLVMIGCFAMAEHHEYIGREDQ